jgi:deoxyribose-phosphate aldolase
VAMALALSSLAAAMDSTNLRLDASSADIRALCEEAGAQGFACVMIYPTSVPLAFEILRGSTVKVGTVIGFPSGRFSTAAKAAEIDAMALAGAHEVDMVIDYGALRDGRVAAVAAEVAELTRRAHGHGQLIKVITENCFLSEPQMLDALSLCEAAGADFIKTSTGFGSSGAKVEQIRLWASHRRSGIQLKAAGGIKTLADARALLEAGATRLGTSNARAILAEAAGAAPTAGGAY